MNIITNWCAQAMRKINWPIFSSVAVTTLIGLTMLYNSLSAIERHNVFAYTVACIQSMVGHADSSLWMLPQLYEAPTAADLLSNQGLVCLIYFVTCVLLLIALLDVVVIFCMGSYQNFVEIDAQIAQNKELQREVYSLEKQLSRASNITHRIEAQDQAIQQLNGLLRDLANEVSGLSLKLSELPCKLSQRKVEKDDFEF